MKSDSAGRAGAVGFVGVGAMGAPMARNVLRARPVVVYDVDAVRTAELATLGAEVASSLDDVARAAKIVVVMVATPAQLRDVLVSSDGAASLGTGHTVVVMSSVGVDAVTSIAEDLRGRGVGVVDAPVTGGVARARSAELTVLAGAATEDLARVQPVLDLMSQRVAVCGDKVGDGQAVKLVNQLLCSVHLAAAAEALAFSRALGLDPAVVLGAVESGAAASFMLSDRGPRMLAADEPDVLSAIDIFVKDTSLVLDAAQHAEAHVPLAGLTSERFIEARERGWGRRDDSRLIDLYGTTPNLTKELIS
ncbi:NAD(P)-dependent oxidoreductase [Pseudactinotalea sp.]|uniref:NAD(P)-dependent oxidoreductase n=1 Tax=Pseudactinotalea sp. TaxID=1926260 RepID=UPI003B3AAC3E